MSQTAIHTARPIRITASREVIILGITLATLQVLDGILTGLGIQAFGTAAEGNALLRYLMEQWGYVTALVTVKVFAISVVGMLCILASVVPWLRNAMKAVIIIYLFAAILPWTAILVKNALV